MTQPRVATSAIGLALPVLLLLLGTSLAGTWSASQTVQEAERPSAPGPRITAAEAKVVALNRLELAPESAHLVNLRHQVSYTAEGLTFQPTHGPSWRWSLVSLGAEGVDLTDLALGSAVPRAAWPRTIYYARGSVREEYHARTGSIEQRFVIERPLPLDGRDLVIQGSIACEGQFSRVIRGWEWRTPTGRVALGDVTVFDRDGARLPARMEVTADRTQIVVDGPALASAAYPVTVDPEILGSDTQLTNVVGALASADVEEHTDVAYNSTDDLYLVVAVADVTAAANHEVIVQLVDGSTGMPSGSFIQVSDMGSATANDGRNAQHPRVAWNSTDNQFLVVWSGDDDRDFGGGALVDDEFEIYGQRLVGSTGLETGTNDFRLSDMGTDQDAARDGTFPAVAYNSVSNNYLVVWVGDDHTDFGGGAQPDDAFEVYGQLLTNAGAETGTNDFRISDMGNNDTVATFLVANDGTGFGDAPPALAFNATDNQYLVVWSATDDTPGAGEFEVFGQRLDATGGEVGTNDFRISAISTDGNAARDAFGPSVAHNSSANEYLVVYSGDDALNDQFDLFATRLSSAGAIQGTQDTLIGNAGNSGRCENPDVAYVSATDEYFVTFAADDLAPAVDNEFEIFAQRVTAAGVETGGDDVALTDVAGTGTANNQDPLRPRIALNGTTGQILVVYRADDLVNNEQEVYGQFFAEPAIFTVTNATVSVAETSGTVTIDVTRGGATAGSVAVDLVTADGTATSPADYTGGTFTVSFAPGETTQQQTIAIINDTVAEANETFTVSLQNPTNSATVGTQDTTTVTITGTGGGGGLPPPKRSGGGDCSLAARDASTPQWTPAALLFLLALLASWRRSMA